MLAPSPSTSSVKPKHTTATGGRPNMPATTLPPARRANGPAEVGRLPGPRAVVGIADVEVVVVPAEHAVGQDQQVGAEAAASRTIASMRWRLNATSEPKWPAAAATRTSSPSGCATPAVTPGQQLDQLSAGVLEHLQRLGDHARPACTARTRATTCGSPSTSSGAGRAAAGGG